MDALVEAALRKWPHVPHVRGWLRLDTRGRWWLRDEAAQAAGAFPHSRGSLIEHGALAAFIGRNYAADDAGAWYFQNGPQRVYVELEAAPWVWRVDDATFALRAHTGAAAAARGAWTDEHGRLFLDSDLGLGLVHTADMERAARALEHGAWALQGELPFAQMPQRFGYRPSPAADAAAAATAAP